ncbi:MAG TPA: cation:proton antiporter [Polyangiales bacterium]|nr:cation:proton antiporter [Polyangiales bacterium]
MTGSYSMPPPGEETHARRQIAVIVLLLFGMVALYQFEQFTKNDFDPTGMLALGFVVLASYTIGGLVSQIRLPHITGYLIAGLVFGPSLAKALSGLGLPPPFDKGILNDEVIEQLSLFDTLAVALIAITAGGELKLEGLRKGLRVISSVLAAQIVSIGVLITGLMWLISGVVPFIALPGLEGLPMAAALAVGAMVASVSLATSPAATIAVIMESRANGPMTRNVLSVVVLKDVVVVMAFAVAQVFVAREIGVTAMEGGIGAYLVRHILVSIIFGAVVVGGSMALYIRFVNQELLIFVVGVVYLVAFITSQLGWDPVLVFLAAGFGVSNFSKTGHRLIETVERLSLPVYVVFFTLAGAKLHLDQLRQVALFAVALVSIRAFAIYGGTNLGARLGKADEATRTFGWMGFVSQAGVSILLAAIVGNTFGELGRSIETLIIGGVAINELVGPVLFKVGLSLAGETSSSRKSVSPAHHLSVKPPALRPEAEGGPPKKLEPWPEHVGEKDLWGEPLRTESDELNTRMQDLAGELQSIVREVSTGPLREFQVESSKYLRDLRREFLRQHRRLTVQARSEDQADRDELLTMLRSAQSELAAHWRGIVLGRSVTLSKHTWTPETLLSSVDAIVEDLPEIVDAPYEDLSYQSQEGDSVWKTLRRQFLRLQRGWRKTFGQSPPTREVRLRALGRFHLSFDAPARLEGLAALFVEADRHLAARTRSLFDGVIAGYEDVVDICADPEADLERQLVQLRNDVEEELALALDEVLRITSEGTQRAASALATGFVRMKEDLPTFGTLDLPASERRTSRRFATRMRAMETLTKDVSNLRRASSAEYSSLAMELELLGLEARVKDNVAEYVLRLINTVKRRAISQVERVSDTLETALAELNVQLESDYSGDELAAALRKATEATSKISGEAARVTNELYQDLSDDTKIAPLLDALVDACRSLTPRYRVTVGQRQTGEWRLPSALPEVEIPFREVVLTYIDSQVAPKLLASRRELAERVQPLANLLQELERVVAFNVELATAELEVVHDEVIPEEMHTLLREMVYGQLERSYNSLEEIRIESKRWPDVVQSEMHEAAFGTLEALRLQLAEGEFSKSRLDAMRRAASGLRMIEKAEKPPRVKRLKTQIRNGLRALFGEERLERWSERIGLAGAVPTEQLTAGAFAAPEVSADLPLVYRRLFAADTMEAGDVLTGRDEEIRRAEAVLSSEVKGRLRSVALVGVDGVGKAAVSSAIVRSRKWKNVRRVVFTGPVTVQDVEAIFQDAPEGQLVVVDGLHWMLSMAPGGFEPLRRFVKGIIEEGGRRRWLAHGAVLFWNFASTVAPLRDAFPEVIQLEPLTEEELQAAVIARHRLSGFEHSFDRGEGSPIEGLFARSASRIRRPYDQYFHELHEATGGLVRDALRLWLASIRGIQEDIVYVGPIPASAYTRVKRLPDDILVNLYQIARQGWIDAAGQARLFRLDVNTAQAQLSRLAHLGLLEEREGAFVIAVHLRGVLGRIFAERQWVL